MAPTIAIVAAGGMGAPVGAQLAKAGLTVYTNLDGRSEDTKRRAAEAGLVDLLFPELISRSDQFLSILPPSDAYSLAKKVVDIAGSANFTRTRPGQLVYVDCNAVNPQTVQQIASLFDNTDIKFVDASIIGGPPSETYNPTFYASARPQDQDVLEKFVRLSDYGLKIKTLQGEGVSVGDASALKMSYSGISKGMLGIITTMILAASAASPTTATALLEELHDSQPDTLKRISKFVPNIIPKAYRFVGEMEEIADFIGEDVRGNEIFHGLAQLYGRVAGALDEQRRKGGGEEIDVLLKFADEAKKAVAKD